MVIHFTLILINVKLYFGYLYPVPKKKTPDVRSKTSFARGRLLSSFLKRGISTYNINSGKHIMLKCTLRNSQLVGNIHYNI